MDVPVSKLRAELKHWLERAADGEEIVVTDHGKPIAKIVQAKELSTYDRLIKEGVITPGNPELALELLTRKRITPLAPVSPLLGEAKKDFYEE